MVLFGTDGVRGLISEKTILDPILEYFEQGIFSKELCGEIGYCASLISGGGPVMIGYDRRPKNHQIADYLARRLSSGSSEVFLLGETTTPALQYEMTLRKAALGIMITASHNPATDTGVKILFRNGRKPTKEEERRIQSDLFRIVEDESPNQKAMPASCKNYVESISRRIRILVENGSFPDNELLIDGSGGWISSWLADLMSSHGVKCKEVGNRNFAINQDSGAGDLAEGEISWEDCGKSSHVLLNEIKPVPKGQIIGFCFDGDGDRCYMIYSDGKAAKIVGGDGFVRLFLQSRGKNEDFLISITIESSLDLTNKILAKQNGRIIETGVGDRWLQHALMREEGASRLGAEPSGHVILEHSIGDEVGLWGDGIMTMFGFLEMARSCGSKWFDCLTSQSGFTMSGSISPSNKSLWDPYGEVGDLAREVVLSRFNLKKMDIKDAEIEGEGGLLMMRFNDGEDWSIAIRNSGTEQKTRVTVRTTSEEKEKTKSALEDIINVLSSVLRVR